MYGLHTVEKKKRHGFTMGQLLPLPSASRSEEEEDTSTALLLEEVMVSWEIPPRCWTNVRRELVISLEDF